MGELFGEPVEGELFYLPQGEFARVRAGVDDKHRRAAIFADMCRINTLYMVARAGSGHLGSSFSALDIVSWLHLEEMKPGDRFFSSKGHDAPGLYSVLLALGKLDFQMLHKLRRRGGLPGHPDIGTPQMVTNTGSLGMGVSKAKGMILANRLQGRKERIYVMTGDGELQEGQFWESLVSAANNRISELTAIVDHNKLQSDTFVKDVSDLGDLEAKLRAYGWHVERCDGNDMRAFAAALDRCRGSERPQVIIADTVKGRGVSAMEHTSMQIDQVYYKFHSGAPPYEAYLAGTRELAERVDKALTSLGAKKVEFESARAETKAATPGARPPQRMVGAYSAALLEHAGRIKNLVAFDADLVLDTGLIPFKEKFPDRFVECGIAEQDMVSQAGGAALRGLLPVVHSFACFLATRPNEQIYNNATERTKIVYAASLAGVVPGGPGHSHQSVRDIAALSGIPGLVLVEGADEAETAAALDWCLNRQDGSAYLRLVSIPCAIPYATSSGALELGRGRRLREGAAVAIIGYGPVLLPQAWHAAETLSGSGLDVRIIDLPWLNRIDEAWLRRELDGVKAVLTLDNHYVEGGQGQMIGAAIARLRLASPPVLRHLGVTDIPVCGTNDEVLAAHGLDASSIAGAVRQLL
jgi:transketolase